MSSAAVRVALGFCFDMRAICDERWRPQGNHHECNAAFFDHRRADGVACRLWRRQLRLNRGRQPQCRGQYRGRSHLNADRFVRRYTDSRPDFYSHPCADGRTRADDCTRADGQPYRNACAHSNRRAHADGRTLPDNRTHANGCAHADCQPHRNSCAHFDGRAYKHRDDCALEYLPHSGVCTQQLLVPADSVERDPQPVVR